MGAALSTRYPGAQSFPDEEIWRRLYFGRESESTALLNKILAHRLVVLFARSGLGKTSLINAGISEALRRQNHIPLSVRVNDLENGPLESVYGGVTAACNRQAIEYTPGDKKSLWDFFKTAQFWRDDVLMTPVLILDQFEELFTLQSEPQRNAFIDQLSNLVRGVSPPEYDTSSSPPQLTKKRASTIEFSPPSVRIVLSLREDFLAELDELSNRIPAVLDERFQLVPLSRTAAASALQEPAKVEDPKLASGTFELDPKIIEQILNFLEQRASLSTKRLSHSVEPFQLQLICQRLEEISSKKQRMDDLVVLRSDDVGGQNDFERILKAFYEEGIDELPTRQRTRARKLCGEFLISPQGRRLRMEEAEIKRLVKVERDVLRKLLEKRLLRCDQTESGIYYELSHDSLVGPVLDQKRTWRILRLIMSIIYVAVLAISFVILRLSSIVWLLPSSVQLPIFKIIYTDSLTTYVDAGVGLAFLLCFILMLIFIPLTARSIFSRAKLEWMRIRHS